MILTVTLNPSIDIRYNINNLLLGKINRVFEYDKTIGGKGLNVTRVIKKLGEEVLATGFLGGKLGEEFEERLNTIGIKNDFQNTSDKTRNCINILHNGISTEILESGPVIKEGEWENFKNKFKFLSEYCKYISISGSLPDGLSYLSYFELIEIANKNQCKVFLDTSGEALKNSLKSKPYFIKPNLEELENLSNKTLTTIEEIINEAKMINDIGIKIVAVTLGENGAVLTSKDKILIAKNPNVEVVNTVGCGDSFVAGFITASHREYSLEDSFKLAIACGISNALLPDTGNICLDTVNKLINQIDIKNY